MTGTSLTSATAFSPSLEAIKLAASMYNAAREGNKKVLEEAILDGLPPNLTNEKGDTLLMLAAYYGHADLVKLLIQHGADPNRLNDKRQSPLAGAVFKGLDSVIEASQARCNHLSRASPSQAWRLLGCGAGGADPEYGTPSAIQCLAMFKQEGKWADKFAAAPGRGKAKAVPQDQSEERAPETFKA
ncbi:ankyrin-like protein [Colletotrichum incanum]|uniref:Ankyrin-like protein n=1 Tax=Colletotrichum incanum TaxID=1573173 RepID=A0A162N0A9_COLIC|nr:ankyrin-like protein [Colletotrichum incanum]